MIKKNAVLPTLRGRFLGNIFLLKKGLYPILVLIIVLKSANINPPNLLSNSAKSFCSIYTKSF
ncbi:hypothetical protein RHT_01217 [Candidatus Rhabdochlamydia sp. T3358]|nr:hypothetical protein RHT_01217 [Candidatus Rhabdochlamydia sp. T3358]